MRRLFPRSRSATPTRKSDDLKQEFDPETKAEDDSVSQPSPVRKSFKPSVRGRPGSEPPGQKKSTRSSSAPATRKAPDSLVSGRGRVNPCGKSPSSPGWIIKQAGRVLSSSSRTTSPSPDRAKPKPPPSSPSSSVSSTRFNRFQRSPKTSQDRSSPSSSISKSETGAHEVSQSPSRKKSVSGRIVGMMTSPKGGMNPRPRPKGSRSRDMKSSKQQQFPSSDESTPPAATKGVALHPPKAPSHRPSSSSKPAPVKKGTSSAPRSSSAKPSPVNRKVPPPVRGKSVTNSTSRGKSASTIPLPSAGGITYKKRILSKEKPAPREKPPRASGSSSRPGQDSIDRVPHHSESQEEPPPPPPPPPQNTDEIGKSRTINFSAAASECIPGTPSPGERPMSPRLLAQMPLPTAEGEYTSPVGSGLSFDGTFKGWSYSSRPEIRLGELVAVDFLGEGHFGQVKCVAWKPNKGSETKGYFALKILERDRFENKMVASGRSEEYYIFNEREIMIEVNSPFHIKLINTYKSSKNLYILMEYAPGRNLKDQIERGKGITDSSHQGAMTRVKFYAANLVLAMEHLHRKQITHRDLKPGNILIDNQGYIKVCDYGFSRWLPIGGKTRSIAGTFNYLTPEQCLDAEYDHSVDIWCIGITVYNMTYGSTPFEAPEGSKDWQKITMNNIQHKPLTFIESKRDLPMPGKLFVKSILSRDSNRFGHDLDYTTIKNHVWFNGVDFDALEKRQLKAPWIPEEGEISET